MREGHSSYKDGMREPTKEILINESIVPVAKSRRRPSYEDRAWLSALQSREGMIVSDRERVRGEEKRFSRGRWAPRPPVVVRARAHKALDGWVATGLRR